jgi:hypothetical protein
MSLFVLFALATPGQLLQYEPDSSITLKGEMLTFAEHDRRTSLLAQSPYVLHWKIGSGELMYVGIRHTYEAADPQIALVKDLWSKFKPDTAFIEGRSISSSTTIENAVKSAGEGGATAVLARGANVPVYTLELTRESEIRPIVARFGEKNAALFVTLRGYFSERRTKAVPDGSVSFMLARRQAQFGLGRAFASLDEMDAFWKASYGGLGDWRSAEERVMWPGEERTDLNRMANMSNRLRDEHMMRSLIDACRKGKRVFATVGRSHVLNQEPVLRASAPPQELEHTTKRPW